jgi:GTP-dependent phosphoenolpyruvate carboxykinase
MKNEYVLVTSMTADGLQVVGQADFDTMEDADNYIAFCHSIGTGLRYEKQLIRCCQEAADA